MDVIRRPHKGEGL